MFESHDSPSEHENIRLVASQLYTNRALIQFKLEKYTESLESANYVLNYFDPDNFKALMRKAEALVKLGRHSQAL